MLRSHSQSVHSGLVALDVSLSGLVLILMLSFPFASGVRRGDGWELTPALLAVALCACMAWPLTLQQLGLYDSQRRDTLDEIVGRLAGAGLVSTLLLTVTTYLSGAPLAPKFPLLFGAAQFSILMIERLALFEVLRFARRLGRNTRNVLIVGSGPRAVSVRRRIEQNPHWGLRVLGFLDDADSPVSPEIEAAALRKLIDVRRILRDEVVDEVIIAAPRSMFSAIGPVVSACGEAGVPFNLLADVFGEYLPPPQVTRFGSLAALRFAPVHHSQTRIAGKRALDLLGAGIGLAASAPILALAAIAIKLTSPGPALFRQTRCGLYGRRFTLYKLRTMVNEAEALKEALAHLNEMSGPVFKVRNDPRITPLGRWLRRFSIDELPQLWNVLRGHMSLVGPRPALPHEVAQYETFERRRLSMRPGLTCLWQVSGRNRVSSFDEWVRMDLEYIDGWSLALDLRLLVKTIPVVLRASGE
jgi:exopolysaccharide biosynthesis polyprenyl glycosylphosphotransferase